MMTGMTVTVIMGEINDDDSSSFLELQHCCIELIIEFFLVESKTISRRSSSSSRV